MSSPRPILAALIVVMIGVPGCASIPADERAKSDPWEPMNRSLYGFNTAIDKVTTKPLAKGYRKITPAFLRKGISNFFDNLLAPRSVINNILQGKPVRGLSEIGRFVINSTIGVGGLFDVATATGIEERREDFGQTFAVWGVPDGPYLMVPFLGPKTLRDALSSPLDIFSDPLYYYNNSAVRDKLYIVRIIDLRYRLLATEKYMNASKDKYVTLRESYLQNRQYEVYDGDPPENDEFFDEFLEEE